MNSEELLKYFHDDMVRFLRKSIEDIVQAEDNKSIEGVVLDARSERDGTMHMLAGEMQPE